jgi:hypothetical protein
VTDPNKPFLPSTANLDAAGPPPETPETTVQPLSPETVAAFNARAEEAAIRSDIRIGLMNLLGTVGDLAARKLLAL